jgi:hypothetical protein
MKKLIVISSLLLTTNLFAAGTVGEKADTNCKDSFQSGRSQETITAQDAGADAKSNVNPSGKDR